MSSRKLEDYDCARRLLGGCNRQCARDPVNNPFCEDYVPCHFLGQNTTVLFYLGDHSNLLRDDVRKLAIEKGYDRRWAGPAVSVSCATAAPA